MSYQFIDIILFGILLVFLIFRLKSILGSSEGKIISINSKKNQFKKPKIIKSNESADDAMFLKGASKAFQMIIEAYQNHTLQDHKRLIENEFFNFLIKHKHSGDKKLVSLDDAKILNSTEKINYIEKEVEFKSSHIQIESNEIAELDEKWIFRKDKSSNDPNWILISINQIEKN